MQFDDARPYDQVLAIYDTNIAYLRDAMKRFVAGEDVGEHVRACYPFVRAYRHRGARRFAAGVRFCGRPGTMKPR
jgi:AMP nucleosidase